MAREAPDVPEDDDLLAAELRVGALRATELLDTLPEEAFDRCTRLAARVLEVPISLVSLIDAERQFVKSEHGFGPWLPASRNLPLDLSFCPLVTRARAALVVEDVANDDRVRDHPGRTRFPVGAYAGVPLVTAEGAALGTLCVVAPHPRPWSTPEVELLHDLAAMVMTEIELHMGLAAAQRRAATLQDAARSIDTLHVALDAAETDRLRVRDEAQRVAADLAHELRTPLQAVRMMVEDLGAGAVPEVVADLERIDWCAREALAVVEHQLELARAEAGRGTLRLADVEVADVLSSLRGMLEPLRRSPDVALAIPGADGMPTLHTDGAKLTQILRNLVTNALRHTDVGEVRVDVALAHDAARIRFRVLDTGCGIPPEDHERIFGVWEQLDGPARSSGSGLGLPLARRMSELLDGSIALESAVGRGSVFTLELPVVAPGIPAG